MRFTARNLVNITRSIPHYPAKPSRELRRNMSAPDFSGVTPATSPLEGLIGINKPSGISSAEALRMLQGVFKPSKLFAPTFALEAAKRAAEPPNQRRRRKGPNAVNLEVKIGHGGTLDPMAQGVLIAGIYGGTKELGSFLGCTKTYECVMMLGADTDSYDAMGKVVRWAGWEGITKEMVEEKLQQFKGEIMQVPPIYSALHMNGKRLYEYAREGVPLPVEIKARPVSTVSLEMVDWSEEHDYEFPEEAALEEKVVAEKIEKQKGGTAGNEATGEKRAAEIEEEEPAKKPKTDDHATEEVKEAAETTRATKPEGKPPIITLRMTVTSGFYVRSLVHDLGVALGSAAFMVKLVRTRQADFEIGKENTLEWEELTEQPEEVWGPKVEALLNKWKEEKQKKIAEGRK
ncbi:pseudouridine synthase [Pyronema omphalodes]|nr:pseudouridine synthase [Pyronema omphalodes]